MHIASSAVYKRPYKYTEEFDQYASPALINRSGTPSAGEVGLNIRLHTSHREPAVLTGRLGPNCVFITRTQGQQKKEATENKKMLHTIHKHRPNHAFAVRRDMTMQFAILK